MCKLCGTRITIADVGGEELNEAADSIFAGVGEQRGHTPGGRLQRSGWYGDDR
jgi:hypothetical protein